MPYLIFAIVMMVSSFAAADFTSEQHNILLSAKSIGEEIGWPETIQAMVLQETHAGNYGNRIGDLRAPVGKRSYGIGQIKVATARFVFNNFPNIKEQYFGDRKVRNIPSEEIIVLLMTDDEACLVIMSRYFQKLLKMSEGNWVKAVAAYNGGWGVASKLKDPKNFPYVKHIRRRIIKEVRPFNARLVDSK